MKYEISELATPTALKRFGAPFKSEYGEVAPVDSDLPLLRYIFVHHVRNFPFLDQAREKEFWQDKLQVVSRFFGQSSAFYLTMLVPRIVCEQAHILFRRSPGRDEAAEACVESSKAGRANDGLCNTHSIRL